ncbi:MAG TPA: protein translocase subunit SecD [Candidatus Methylacidiphilales bacterium]|jgi:SecD/SecF fusion protein|nr:protein translocase subunit SecD [Candidatus Methylacidiphilales bacterium]
MQLSFSIFIASLGFIGFFVWYLAAENAASRRAAGVGVIAASLLTCGLALYPIDKSIRLGLDLQGGTEFLLEVQGNPSSQALDQVISVFRKRLDALGTREISIQPEGKDRLKIQIPGLQGAEVGQTENVLSQVAKLEFQLVPQNGQELLAAAMAHMVNGKPTLPYQYALDYEVLPELEKDAQGNDIKSWIVVENKVQMTGKGVTHADVQIEQAGTPVVELEFDSVGRQQFGEVTSANVGRLLAIVLDRVVRSAPRLNEPILDGRAVISGGTMSRAECEDLASVLQNPLENPVKMLSTNSVDASLGADSIQSGLHAGIIALLLVISFMVIYYRVSGTIAVLALTVNLVLLFGLLAQFHFTLTLPGIAGVVLTIGMAVDANVLIYERIRDELALGKPARSAIDIGFEKAFSAIFDSNVTTLIPAIVLAYFGTGPLRGFAVTLVLGIVANLFAALVVTRNTFDWILTATDKPNLSMMQFIKSPRFDFLRYRGFGLIVSLVLLAAGTGAVAMKGDTLLGVDFKGGDAVTMTYTQPVDIGQVRQALLKNGMKDVMLQPVSGSTSGRYALQIQTEEQQGERAVQILENAFPHAGFVAGSVDKIGAQVGGEMKQRALTALLMGLLGILIYAAIRFEWSYAIAAAVGQLHDVLIALSIMALLGRELTLPLVGALLTIAGYSINDKIVVFDRIREGAKMREKGSFYEVINRSLNLTLARTILTGSTCLLATGALIVFGGPVIHDFSLAMFIGIMSGIYSSHFISPGLAWWLGRAGQGSGSGNSGRSGVSTPTAPAPGKKAAVGV